MSSENLGYVEFADEEFQKQFVFMFLIVVFQCYEVCLKHWEHHRTSGPGVQRVGFRGCSDFESRDCSH